MESVFTLFFLILLVCIFFIFRKLNMLLKTAERIEQRLTDMETQNTEKTKIEESYPDYKKEILPIPVAEKKVKNIQIPQRLRKFVNWLLVSDEYYQESISWEYTAATAWLIRAGILILICGSGFMLKYSIEHNLFSPALRISGMTLLGVSAAVTGYTFTRDNKYRQLFIGICGGGFALLLLSIFAGFRIYDLYSAVIALTASIAVIIAALAAACKKSSQVLAIISAIGVFAAPWILSDNPEYLELLAYWIIPGVGLLILSERNNWGVLRVLVILEYSFSALCGASVKPAWIILPLLFINLVICGTAFFFRRKLYKADYLLWLLAMGVFLFLALDTAFNLPYGKLWKLPTVVALAASGINCCFFILTKKRESNSFFLVLTIACVVLACGLLGIAKWLTAMWSILALALAIAAGRSNNRQLAICSILLFIITVLTLPDNSNIADGYLSQLLHNIFSFGIYPVSSITASHFLYRKNAELNLRFFPKAMAVSAGIFLFIYLTFEMNAALKTYRPDFQLTGISVWWSILALILSVIGVCKQKSFLRKSGAAVFGLSCLKILLIDLSDANSLWRICGFCSVGLLLLGTAVIYILKKDIFRIEK